MGRQRCLVRALENFLRKKCITFLRARMTKNMRERKELELKDKCDIVENDVSFMDLKFWSVIDIHKG